MEGSDGVEGSTITGAGVVVMVFVVATGAWTLAIDSTRALICWAAGDRASETRTTLED